MSLVIKKSNLAIALTCGCFSGAVASDIKLSNYGSGTEKTANILDHIDSLNDLKISDYNSLNEAKQSEIAKQYSLTPKEYKEYLAIKTNTAIGQYYADKNLNPNQLLAEKAIQDNDQKKADKYIGNMAKQEYAAVTRLLKIQSSFQKFAQEQHPDQTPIKLKGKIPDGYTSYGYQKHNNIIESVMDQVNTKVLTSNAEYVLIEDVNHSDKNIPILKEKLSKLSNTKLNIYFIGNATDDQIIAWSTKYNLGQDIASNKVTVNHAGTFVGALEKQMGSNLNVGNLIKNNNGNYQTLSWGSLYASK
jgi:hypothetical protein